MLSKHAPIPEREGMRARGGRTVSPWWEMNEIDNSFEHETERVRFRSPTRAMTSAILALEHTHTRWQRLRFI